MWWLAGQCLIANCSWFETRDGSLCGTQITLSNFRYHSNNDTVVQIAQLRWWFLEDEFTPRYEHPDRRIISIKFQTSNVREALPYHLSGHKFLIRQCFDPSGSMLINISLFLFSLIFAISAGPPCSWVLSDGNAFSSVRPLTHRDAANGASLWLETALGFSIYSSLQWF